MDAAELKKIIKIAQKNGLKRIKTGDLELEFADSSAVSQNLLSGGLPLSSEEERMPTDDEMLMRSSPYYDVLMDQREAATKKPPQ